MEIDNNSAFWQLQVTVHKDDAQRVEQFFMNAQAVGFYELLYEENVTHNLTTDTTALFFFFDLSFPLQAFCPMAATVLDIDYERFQIEKISFADYAKMFEQYFKSFRLGKNIDLVVPWDIPPQPSNPYFLLRPGLAFGTGKHITSQLMTCFIEDHVLEDDVVFDLGCGSGILSLACALKKAKTVVGADVINLAVESAQDNLALNQEHFAKTRWEPYFNNIRFYKGDFAFYQTNHYPAHTNVFLANILGKVFYANAEHLRFYFTNCSKWALSGITELQRDEFANFLQKMEINEYQVKVDDEWCIFYKG